MILEEIKEKLHTPEYIFLRNNNHLGKNVILLGLGGSYAYCAMWNELQNTTKQYNKIGKRNSRALNKGKISKHMMHTIRLYSF